MRYILLLADIHANEPALRAVKLDAHRRYRRVREFSIWFLGDLFGRGPESVGTWFTLQSYQPEAYVVGNHDWGIIGRNENLQLGMHWAGFYNPSDWSVLLLHRQELLIIKLLEQNEAGKIINGPVYQAIRKWPILNESHPGVYLIHGGLDKPFFPPQDIAKFLPDLVWGYVKSLEHVQYTRQMATWLHETNPTTPEIKPYNNVRLSPPQLIILGHWHYRRLYVGENKVDIELNHPYTIPEHTTLPVVMSPGSVGFSAEENDRDASYAILAMDNEVITSITFHTVPYERQLVRQQMNEKGYPEETIRRLRLVGENDY